MAGSFGRNSQRSMDRHKISQQTSHSGSLWSYRNPRKLRSDFDRHHRSEPNARPVDGNANIQREPHTIGEPYGSYQIEKEHERSESTEMRTKTLSDYPLLIGEVLRRPELRRLRKIRSKNLRRVGQSRAENLV